MSASLPAWVPRPPHSSGTRPGGARADELLELFIIVAATMLAGFALREFLAPDYQAETMPAFQALRNDGLSGFLHTLPGFPGIVVTELIPGGIATWLGAGDANLWRILSAFSVSALALAVMSAVPAIRATEVSRGAARTGVVLAAFSPAAYWALRIGHPEELLATALLLGSVLAAARERAVLAGILLGLAVGKAWPAVVALPVLGLLLPNPRRVALGMLAAVVAVAATYGPVLLTNDGSVSVMANTGVASIFNTGQVFWFFGTPIDLQAVAGQQVPQPRVGATWTGELSHPLILGAGTAIGLVWCWTLYQRLLAAPGASVAALPGDRRTRSLENSAQLASAALQVMAGILILRCVLDTWNVPYYILPALVCGALGEVLAGRRPIMTLAATGLMWRFHAPGDLTIRSNPDIYTALYLSWTIPLAVAFIWLGLRAARGLRTEPAASPAGASVTYT